MAAASLWKGLVGLGLFALAHAAFSAAQRECAGRQRCGGLEGGSAGRGRHAGELGAGLRPCRAGGTRGSELHWAGMAGRVRARRSARGGGAASTEVGPGSVLDAPRVCVLQIAPTCG